MLQEVLDVSEQQVTDFSRHFVQMVAKSLLLALQHGRAVLEQH